jgi:hypothetical protein
LVVNSDDYGACHSINEGVIRAFREGILTQATFMVPCPWFEEAAMLAKEHGMPVGVHLTATCEWDNYRWRPITPARSFTCPDGTLPLTIEEVQKRANPGELEAEFIAQVELVLARGIQPSHFDVHMGVVDAEVTARIIRRYGILSRFPLGPGYEDCVFRFDSHGYLTGDPDRKGMSKKDWLLGYIRGLKDGVHFLSGHLAVRSSEMRAVSSTGSPWAEDNRATDLDAILAPEARQLCRDLDIELISLKDVRS